MKTITHRIGCKPVESASGRYGAVYDPATGAQEKQVGFATADEVDAAVAAAKAASESWGATSVARRTAILFKYRELLDAHRDEVITTRWPGPADGGINLGFPSHS